MQKAINIMEEKSPDCIMIPLDMIDIVWDKCAPFLQKAFISPIAVYDLGDIYTNCLKGNWQLWMLLIDEQLVGCFITVLMIESRAKILNILNLGAEGMKYWKDSIQHKITAFAKKHDCISIQAVARKGFSRIVPEIVEIGTIYALDLRNSHG